MGLKMGLRRTRRAIYINRSDREKNMKKKKPGRPKNFGTYHNTAFSEGQVEGIRHLAALNQTTFSAIVREATDFYLKAKGLRGLLDEKSSDRRKPPIAA